MSSDTPFATLPLEERRKRSLDLQEARLSDRTRWSDPRNMGAAWRQRADAVAALIASPSAVIDLGCGTMVLEGALAPGCTYIPADLVQRDDRTLVFDANAGEVPDAHADVAVMLGLLEYIHDPAGFLAATAAHWPRLVLTYHPVDIGPAARDRRAKGWFNDLRDDEIVALALAAGYRLVSVRPLGTSEHMYDFRRAA